MSIWTYPDVYPDTEYESFNIRECIFCNSQLIWKEIDDLWPDVTNGIEKSHEEYVRFLIEYPAVDSYYEEIEFTEPPEVGSVSCGRCPACGWWLINKTVYLTTKHQSWDVEYVRSGVLKNFDPADVRAPITEIRSFLTAKI